MTGKPNLSVIVVTYNEERNIERCLRSVSALDCEVVVVDSFSTDKTVEIAKRFSASVHQNTYPGYSRQVEWGIARSTGGWVFILDADEEVSPELASSIRSVVNAKSETNGYSVNRRINVFGKWIDHGGWSPDWQFRLVKRDNYIAEHQEVHGGFTASGPKGRLDGLLYHYTYPSLESYLEKLNDYTSLHVSNKLKDKPDITVRWYKIVFSPALDFLKTFFIKKGYRDGIPGFLLAACSALYTLALYAKVWEYRLRESEGKGSLPPVTNASVLEYKRIYTPS